MFFEEIAVYPRVVKVNTDTVINGKFFDIPRNIWREPGTELKLSYVPECGVFDDRTVSDYGAFRDYECEFKSDGTFSFSFSAAKEGEYSFRITLVKDGKKVLDYADFSCYALEDDLYALKPYKGDTHVHTCFSRCGSVKEEPSYVAAFGRERGLDFMFITDHLQREPSILAQDALAGFNSDFRVYPGEECHVPKYAVDVLFDTKHIYSSIHQLALGTSQGVIKYTNDNFEEYQKFVDDRKAELDPELPDAERTVMAAIDWIVKKTHEFGGISIFCHPFWKPHMRLNLTRAVRQYILENGRYDAVEVIGLGGSKAEYFEGNVRCMNWLTEESIKLGRRIPVTGSTDSHNAREISGIQYTLLFARENSCEEVISSIRDGKAVAVSCNFGGYPFVYGDTRLADYAGFLLREFYPEHDEICAAEGKLMLQVLRGTCDKKLAADYSKNLLESLWNRFIGRK